MTKQNLMNRRLKALELKTKGHTIRAIAEQLNRNPRSRPNDNIEHYFPKELKAFMLKVIHLAGGVLENKIV